MRFNVLKYTSASKEEWLDDICVDTLKGLEDEIKVLSQKYYTEVEVDFMSKTILVGELAWYDEHIH